MMLDACYADVTCTGTLLIFALPIALLFGFIIVERGTK